MAGVVFHGTLSSKRTGLYNLSWTIGASGLWLRNDMDIPRNSWCSGKILYCPEVWIWSRSQTGMHSDDVYTVYILTSRMALLSVATVITWYCFGWIISYPGRTRTPTCWLVESTSQVQSRQYSWNERPLRVCFFFTGTLWLRIWTCSHADDMQMLKSCADDMQTSEGLAWTLATFAATFLSAASYMLKTNWIYAPSLHLGPEHQNDINDINWWYHFPISTQLFIITIITRYYHLYSFIHS